MDQVDDWVGWMRVSDSNFPGKTFWGPSNENNEITPQDINQGYIGNCWIMAAISAVAEKKERIDGFMLSDDINPYGIYAMNMYSVGVPFTQIIDD
jgi:hypothetical protein